MKNMVKEGNYLVPGVTKSIDGLIFTFEAQNDKKCEIVIYKSKTDEIDKIIPVPKEFSIGNLFSVEVIGLHDDFYEYNFRIDDEVITDPYAKKIVGRQTWADFSRESKQFQLSGAFEVQTTVPKRQIKGIKITKEDLILYKLNIRSFTMDSNLKSKGTFRGTQEKIPYLKKLGINCVELMPIYEFEELIFQKKDAPMDYKLFKEEWDKKLEIKGIKTKTMQQILTSYEQKDCDRERFNCWGYAEAFYFAPKASYALYGNAKEELRSLIDELHKNEMECILEIHFPNKIKHRYIVDVLKFWTMEYDVDGFHLLGIHMPISLILDEPMLKESKIFYDSYYQDECITREDIFVYNEEFMYASRKMLSFQEPSLFDFINQMKKQSADKGFVNFICDNNGFTLSDLFSYNEKHNEGNGENNIDGNAWNYSTNCGVEGETRKKSTLSVRKKMMRNAIVMLMLAQGTPLLFSGDEFGNSQKGNNNAYCQDNEVGWINWKQLTKNQKFYSFVCKMIAFRKKHPILSLSQPMKMTDYSGKGYPDLSYHGEEAWQAGESINRYTIGMLYCGNDISEPRERSDMIYVAYNFHPQKKTLAVPATNKKQAWFCVMDTSKEEGFLAEEQQVIEKSIELQGQSICILVSKIK